MTLEKLEEKEYEEFAKKHRYANFIQNTLFGELKKKNRWDYVILGVKENNKIIAGVLLLIKEIKFGKKMFYAPRGYLLDYDNLEFFKEFDNEVVKYVKKHGGIVLKIDPYIVKVERDKNANVVEGGLNNNHFIDFLKSIGYKKTKEMPLQAQWMYRINIKNKTYDEIMKDMTSKTRQMIRKNEKNGVVIREGNYDDLGEFLDIFEKTSNRRNFMTRELKYYQDMYNAYSKGNHFKLVFADIDIKGKLTNLENDKKEIYSFLNKVKKDKEKNINKVSDKKVEEKEKELSTLNDRIKHYEEMLKKYGERKTISGIIYINYGKEVLSFIGGVYEEFMEYQPFYTIHYEMIKYAIDNKYDYYNFYGISGDFNPKSSMYGVYQFKRGFGGEVVELIGEYDKKISPLYYLYKLVYKLYRK